MSFPRLVPLAVLVGTAALATTTTGFTASVAQPAQAHHSCYRQLIGTVSSSTYLEASAPAAGQYTIEYDITGTAFFDTYVNNDELGYVGGPSGVYKAHAVALSAGGVLVQVVGPEGAGQAKVYLDQVC